MNINTLQELLVQAQRENKSGNFAQAESISKSMLEYISNVEQENSSDFTSEYTALTIGAMREIMVSLLRRGQAKQALPVAESAYQLSLQSANLAHIAITTSGLGIVYRLLSDYSKALEYFNLSLNLDLEKGNEEGIASTSSNIGSVYAHLSDYTLAMEYFQKALVMYESTANKEGVAVCLANIGLMHQKESHYDTALKFFHQSLAINEELGRKHGIAVCFANIGGVYIELGKPRLALEYLQKSLLLNKELGIEDGVGTVLGNIGNVYATEGTEVYDEVVAERYLLESIAILERISAKQQVYSIHFEIAELYKRQKRWEEHAYHLGRYSTIKEEVRLEEAKKHAERMDYERKISIEQARLEEREKVVAELIALNASLEEANREKNEMLGIVAHDLKNPLTGILLSAESMQRYYTRFSLHEVESRLSHIVSAAEHMKAIVLKLLDIQFIESGRLQLEALPIDLDDVLRATKAEYLQAAEAKQIRLLFATTEIGLIAVADLGALRECIDNLVSNAIKFSPPQTQVTVVASGSGSGCIRIRVTDQGPGLTADDHSKLFGKFMRLSARPTGKEHSTGLGLSIVKKLTEAMNGRIWCESTVGNGATFTIELPRY